MRTISFTQYRERYGDNTAALNRAIEDLKPEGGRLVFEPGRYDFYPELALERMYFVSNNDQGLKRILMPFIDARRISVDGQGAEFILHGRLVPAIFDNAADVRVENITIDYDRPFFTEATVREWTGQSLEISIDPEKYPHYFEDGALHFTGYGWQAHTIINLLCYDAATGDLRTGTSDWYIKKTVPTEQTGRHTYRLHFEDDVPPWADFRPGDRLAIEHEEREVPGFFGTQSKDLHFENVTIHNCGAMAFIMQLCDTVTLSGCRVVPAEGRTISAGADATHFVNCTGTVTLDGCVFEGQFDDATNIHGIYTMIEKITGCELYLKYMHYQQRGIPLYREGDRLRFINRTNMQAFADAAVTEVSAVNQDIVRVVVDAIPDGLEPGAAVENPGRMPDAVIRNCRTAKNRARSFLISTRGQVLIENNQLQSTGSGVYISGDSNYWYESGPVRSVTIRNNRFIGCNRCIGWGHAAIDIVPELPDCSGNHYHRRITIENNEFELYREGIVFARSVDGLVVRGNILKADGLAGDTPGPETGQAGVQNGNIVLQHCVSDIGNNVFDSMPDRPLSVVNL